MVAQILFHITPLLLFSFPSALTAEHMRWLNREGTCQVCRNHLQTENRSHRPSQHIPSSTRDLTGRYFCSVVIDTYDALADALAAELGMAPVGADFGWLDPKWN